MGHTYIQEYISNVHYSHMYMHVYVTFQRQFTIIRRAEAYEMLEEHCNGITCNLISLLWTPLRQLAYMQCPD